MSESEKNDGVETVTSEELFEAHKAEIEARFVERSFFTRIREMMDGLSKPHDSREYKLALIELQRLWAPITAIVLPLLAIIVLFVVTAIAGRPKEAVIVDIADAEPEVEKLDEEEPEPEIEFEPPEEIIEVTVDTPYTGPVSDMVSPTPAPPDTPLSVKPAAVDSVAIVKSPVTMRSMTGSRTPGSIGAMTRGGANLGDANTEAAVLKALRWLKHTQKYDGSWPGPISNTGLAVLAYLAHGELPNSAEFGDTVQRAMQYLVNAQFESPDQRQTFQNCDANEYSTLICTYALCEAYGMTRNPNVKEVAERTLARIVDNQSPTGGWDYKLNRGSTRDDLSYAGWALQALKAGRLAGLQPEGLEECIRKAVHYLKTRAFRDGGFGYTANTVPTGLTATGCLAMQLLGYGSDKEVLSALDFMREWTPSFEGVQGATRGGKLPGSNPTYYCYYASQCKYQAGMKDGALPVDLKSWQDWNAAMKAFYPKKIITLDEKIKGPDNRMHAMGYWENSDPGCKEGGNTMMTCLCALQLMVYYRYLPTTQAQKGGAGAAAGGDAVKAPKKAADVDIDVDI